ncbi:hypothetical protein GCM10010317_021030 [Streptomyces mirabilis]|nr:hypothetical protein GCM10010317_021030 [Streptomyces mirabilis]
MLGTTGAEPTAPEDLAQAGSPQGASVPDRRPGHGSSRDRAPLTRTSGRRTRRITGTYGRHTRPGRANRGARPLTRPDPGRAVGPRPGGPTQAPADQPRLGAALSPRPAPRSCSAAC